MKTVQLKLNTDLCDSIALTDPSGEYDTILASVGSPIVEVDADYAKIVMEHSPHRHCFSYVDAPDDPGELEATRQEFIAVIGKPPRANMRLDNMRKLIEAAKELAAQKDGDNAGQ